MRLAGKVAFVTGAAGGIGAATARRLAREGAREEAAFITGQVLFVDGGMSVGI